MKNLNLGRVVTLLILPLIVFAKINVSVDKNKIYPNQKVTLQIEATGENVIFPKIDKIEGFTIIGRSTSTKLIISNGNFTKKVTKKYSFRVDKNITIPSFNIIVDNKEYKSNPIDIMVVKTKPKSLKEAEAILKASKKELYLGEGVEVDLILKFKKNSNIRDLRIEKFKSTNFWYEQIGKPTQRIENEYIIQTYRFIFFPQRSGKLKLGPIVVNIAKGVKSSSDPFEDDFFNFMFENYIWQKVYSNIVEFNVKPLPQNLEVYGDFTIKAKIDKKRVKANEPVNLTLTIKGVGNIDDIKKFELNIPNAIVYSDEPIIKKQFVNKEIAGKFIQKFAIVADRNYTISPIEFRYFSKSLKKVVTKKTKPIFIEVIGGIKEPIKKEKASTNSANIIKEKKDSSFDNQDLNITSSLIKSKEANNSYLKYLFLIIGVALGVGGYWLFLKIKNKKNKKDIPIIKKIKKAKSNKELLDILLPYSNKNELKNILEKLEQNIYKGKKHTINKDKIVEVLEDLEEKNSIY